ncbi:MAG: efflux RND transporter periplasmic adaptor subunit [Chitinophagales bacterium]
MKVSFVSTLILITAVTATISGCASKGTDDSNKESNTITVKTATVINQAVTVPINSSGIITSKKEARLSFKTGGIISRMLVDEGQNVHSGQLLATLDLTEVNALVAQAQQNAEKMQRDYDRLNNLYKEHAATLEQLQNISTGLEVANQNLTTAKFNQQHSSIYATENGTVIKKLANEGELAAPGNPVFIINSTADTDWVIRIGVADYEWARIKSGDQATVSMDAYPGEIFNGAVSEIADAADPYSGTFQIEMKVNPGSRKFANGLIAKIKLTPSQTMQLSIIPIEALVECSGKKGFVYKLNQDKKTVTKIPVTVAFYLKNQVALSAIDSTTTEVITGGSAYLSANSTVVIAIK